MKVNHFIMFLGLVCLAFSLKVLKKEMIGKNYEIGTIYDLYFPDEKSIFFRSDDDLTGVINIQTGELESLFQLQEGQNIIQDQKGQIIILTKGSKMYYFDHKSIALYQYFIINKQLQKYGNYTQVISFMRNPHGIVILTDKFIVLYAVMQKYRQENGNKTLFQVEYTLEEGQEYFSLIDFHDRTLKKSIIGLVSLIKAPKGKDKLCLTRLFQSKDQTNRKCIDISDTKDVQKVLGNMIEIIIEYKQSIQVYDYNFNKLLTVQQVPTQYSHGLITLGDKHHTILFGANRTSERYIYIINPVRYTMQVAVQETKLIFKKDNEVIATIPKNKQENPKKLWANVLRETSLNEIDIYMQEDTNNKLIVYTINTKDKSFKKKWQLTTIPAIKEIQGLVKKQQDIDAKESKSNKGNSLTHQDQDQDINESNPSAPNNGL